MISLTAQKYPLESTPEFDGHSRVEDGVDGTVIQSNNPFK